MSDDRREALREAAEALMRHHDELVAVEGYPPLTCAECDALRVALAAEPSALDVMVLRRALERGLSIVDDEWTIEELAEVSAAEYVRLTHKKTA